jgi:outer membrane lipoprotein-sorting protein
MRHIVLLAGAAVFFWGAQQTLPKVVVENDQKLQAATALTATYTVQVVGEASSPYELSFAKPNLFKVTGPQGWVLSDGKTIYEYTSKDNAWTEKPLNDATLAEFVARPEVMGWTSFFLKDALKQIAGAKVGSVRNLKGNPSVEVIQTPSGEGKEPMTVYVDQKLGVVRSYQAKLGPNRDLLVLASEISVGFDPVDPKEFSFVPPSGAKKVEPTKAATGATYAAVQGIMNAACMPCHNSVNRKDDIDLTSYEGIVSVVTPGSPGQSLLVKALKGMGAQKMPKGRSSLPTEQIRVIEDWIGAGAKR